jgi:hypothetical protein
MGVLSAEFFRARDTWFGQIFFIIIFPQFNVSGAKIAFQTLFKTWAGLTFTGKIAFSTPVWFFHVLVCDVILTLLSFWKKKDEKMFKTIPVYSLPLRYKTLQMVLMFFFALVSVGIDYFVKLSQRNGFEPYQSRWNEAR